VRRAVAAVIGTVAGTTLLVAAKLGVHPPAADLAAGGDTSVVAGAADPASRPAGDDPETEGTPSAAGTAAAAPTTAPPRTGAPTTAPPRTTAPSPTAGTGLRNGSFTGTGVKERYGTITVTVSVSGGRITDASGACGGCNGESQSISSGAFTRLRQEALQAQSASIATVSGATYTSTAYKSSLQAALNAAHA
jgi:uncharacterized protein with FMN-binding domain